MRKKPEEKKTQPFYADKLKYTRALEMVKAGEYKKLVDAYKAIGGAFSEGTGYAEV